MAVETELKFNVPGVRLKALEKLRFRGGKIGPPSEHDLLSTYFDTTKHKLKRHGLTLRVRRDGNNYVQTVKSANAAQERHKLRIRAKKIRYGLEFFESLFQSKREQKQLAGLSKHLKKVQNALGSLNDFVAHRDMAVDAALRVPAPRGDGRARAFASGVVLGREDQTVKPLVKVAAKEVRRLEVI
jgi:inorganic triphosphatase YgiF